jgi:hypothetical protein
MSALLERAPISPMLAGQGALRGALRHPWLLSIFFAGWGLIGLEHIVFALNHALWFDEGWTAAIASTNSFGDFLGEVRQDVNAPAFYGLIRLWAEVFGTSDLALKAPGLLLAMAAPLIALGWRVEGVSPAARTTWAALLCAWWGVDHFLDARCYSLLFALSVGQTAAFAALIQHPDRHSACLWAALASLGVLTHYFAIFPLAAQGLIFLAVHPRRGWRTWPAALMFLPAAAWMAFHASRLLRFTGDDVAWRAQLDFASAAAFASDAVAPSVLVVLAATIVLLALKITDRAATVAGGEGPAVRSDPRLWWVAASGAMALAAILVVGMSHPTLAPRYLVPCAAPLLFGVVLAATSLRRSHLACALLAVIYLISSVRTPAQLAAEMRQPPAYGYELASRTLATHGVSDVVFLWDHPAAQAMQTSSLQRVGAVFLRRDGNSARVRPLIVSMSRDANQALLAAATGERPGLIWLYDRTGRTSARTYPPNIAALDRRWSCERAGDEIIGTLACWRAAQAPPIASR